MIHQQFSGSFWHCAGAGSAVPSFRRKLNSFPAKRRVQTIWADDSYILVIKLSKSSNFLYCMSILGISMRNPPKLNTNKSIIWCSDSWDNVIFHVFLLNLHPLSRALLTIIVVVHACGWSTINQLFSDMTLAFKNKFIKWVNK